MKKLKIFALLGFFALFFSSCEKEDAFLIGKWNIDKMTFSFTYMSLPFSQTLTNQGWVEFKDGGAGTDDEGGSFTWSLSGDNLTITDDDGSTTMNLTTKEDNKIVGEWSETDEYEGTEITMDYVIEMSKL